MFTELVHRIGALRVSLHAKLKMNTLVDRMWPTLCNRSKHWKRMHRVAVNMPHRQSTRCLSGFLDLLMKRRTKMIDTEINFIISFTTRACFGGCTRRLGVWWLRHTHKFAWLRCMFAYDVDGVINYLTSRFLRCISLQFFLSAFSGLCSNITRSLQHLLVCVEICSGSEAQIGPIALEMQE